MNDHERAIVRADRLRAALPPHRLVKDSFGCLWETISYPRAVHDGVVVDIRIPGDPTSVITVDVSALDPEGGQTCVCDRAGEFYFKEREENAVKRQKLRQAAQGYWVGLGRWN